MSRLTARELSKSVNAEARQRFQALAKQTGIRTVTSQISPRFALRMQSPYPYKFVEDDAFYPDESTHSSSFGRVIQASRYEGLHAIHERVPTEANEHKWLYIPERKLWLDTTLSTKDISVESDQNVQTFLSYLYPVLESVHTHPDKTIALLASENQWDYSENYLMEGALPSTNDLLHNALMLSRSAPGSTLAETVVSHHGAVSFSMVETGENRSLFYAEPFERRIRNMDDSMNAITSKLGDLSLHTLQYDDVSPAFHFTYLPLE